MADNLNNFDKIWETNYLNARVNSVYDAVKEKDYEQALDYLSMFRDKVAAAESVIRDALK